MLKTVLFNLKMTIKYTTNVLSIMYYFFNCFNINCNNFKLNYTYVYEKKLNSDTEIPYKTQN